MHPKPFPPEKRVSLAQKSFEEFEKFFHELPRGVQEKGFPDKIQGFRQGSPEGRRIFLQQLWSDAKKPEGKHHERAWVYFGHIWNAWVVSQAPLQALLEKFDNSSDFQDNTPSPPNTALDLECFRYLSSASIKGSISQELIQRFYNFGYFQQDNMIESYICLARSETDIQKNNDLMSGLKYVEDHRKEFQIFRQHIEEIINKDILEKELDSVKISLKESEEKLGSLQEKISSLLILSSRFFSLEQQILDFNTSVEHSIQEQQHLIEKIMNQAQKYTEDIELLSVMTDENSRTLEDFRTSWCPPQTAQISPPTPPDILSSGSYNLKTASPPTPPIHRGDEFLQHRLLPTLEKWLLDITPRWATLFHHAIWACQWVLVPNPAWAVAYQEAMGEMTHLHIIQVEPTWLCFADAWRVVAPAWQAAQQQTDCLHLLLFEDVNRALPECWARPWLDMLAGFRKVLPVEGQPAWPVNLRILASLASDQAALPLSKTVVQHWAAVSIQPVGERSSEPAQCQAGHVPWALWQSWGTGEETTTCTLSQMASKDGYDAVIDWPQFGPLAHSVARDLGHLEASMRYFDPSIDTLRTVKNIRSTWPQEYLLTQENTDE